MFSARKCLQVHHTQPRKLVSATEQILHSFIHKKKILFKAVNSKLKYVKMRPPLSLAWLHVVDVG